MKLDVYILDRIKSCGCHYMGIGHGCFRCPFEEARKNAGVSCNELVYEQGLLLRTAIEAYRTDKKFAEIFDKRCPEYKYLLRTKAVIL